MIDIATCFTYAYSAGTLADFMQTVTADAASTNIIDLDAANVRIGAAKMPFLIVRVGTVFATIVSLNIRVQTDTDSGFATALKDIMQARFTAAQMTAGALLINRQLPVGIYQRYLRLYFDVFTSATGGTLLAYLASGPETAVAQVDETEAAS